MNIRKLKRNLPRGASAVRDGQEVQVTIKGHQFKVDRRSGWSEPDLAQYLQSKIPTVTIKPGGHYD